MIHRALLILAGLFLVGAIVVAVDTGLPALSHAHVAAAELGRVVPRIEERLNSPGALPLRPAHLQQLREAIEAQQQRAREYRDQLFPAGGSISDWLTAAGGPYETFRGDRTGLYLEIGNDTVLAALANGVGEQHAALELRTRETFAALSAQEQERALLELMLARRVVAALGDAGVSDLRRLRFDTRPRPGPYGDQIELLGLDLTCVAAPDDVRRLLRRLLASGWEPPALDVAQIRLTRIAEEDWGLHTTRYTAPPVEARIRLRLLVPWGPGPDRGGG